MMFEEGHLHVGMHAKQPNIRYRICLETQRSSFPMYIYFKQYILVLLLTYKEGVVFWIYDTSGLPHMWHLT